MVIETTLLIKLLISISAASAIRTDMAMDGGPDVEVELPGYAIPIWVNLP